MTSRKRANYDGMKYLCMECGKQLKSRQSHWYHKHYLCPHKTKNKFQCPSCEHSTNLKECVQALENGDKQKFTCWCGKSYAHKRSLRTHQKFQCSNKDNPQFACPYCPLKTTLKGNLKTHIVTKHLSG